MAFWPFNIFSKNKQTDTALPPEIQNYYNSQQKERVGVAWLIGVLTLVVFLAFAVGMFYAGRWIYDDYIKKPQQETHQTTEDHDTEQNNQEPHPEDSAIDANDTDEENVPTSLPGGGQARGESVETPQTGSTSTDTPAIAPNDALIRTGPDLDL